MLTKVNKKSQNGSVASGYLSTFIAVKKQPSDPCLHGCLLSNANLCDVGETDVKR